MTEFDSKRQAAQAKLDDDDTQVQADTLLIVYQRGFADGKRSAQRKPLTDEEIMSYEGILSAEKRYEDYTMQESIVTVGAVDFARAIEAAHGIKERNT
jgi:hypothetical protein